MSFSDKKLLLFEVLELYFSFGKAVVLVETAPADNLVSVNALDNVPPAMVDATANVTEGLLHTHKHNS